MTPKLTPTERRLRRSEAILSDKLRAQIKTAPGVRCGNSEPKSQGLTDADRSAS